MKVIICDDLASDRQTLGKFLHRFEQEQNVELTITEYASGEALLAAFAAGANADIVFIDIYMKGISGMEAAQKLYAAGFDGSLVFCTGSAEHAVASYTVNAAGYIVKPYTYADFTPVLQRIRAQWARSRKSICFLSSRLELCVYLKDIIYIETRRKGSLLYVRNEVLETSKKIGEFWKELHAEAAFLRLGKSYIINMNFIKNYDNDFLYLTNDARVMLPVRNKQQVCKAITDYRWLVLQED